MVSAGLSRDAGMTWTACSGPQGQVIGFHFDRTENSRTMFAATERGIWRSDDNGQTWAESTEGLPWKEIQGFGGGSDSAGTMLYCTVTSKLENGVLQGGIYRSRDRGHTWQSAMGHGINVDTTKADQWSYGSIAQYKHVLVADAKPYTVYVTNTSTGFHPPHHETVYRSDDGGDTWRATFFQDPRFEQYNVAPNYVTASADSHHKGGNTPFDAAICDSDPNRLILVWSQSYVTHNGGETWFNGDTYPAAGQSPGPGSAWACTGLVVTTTWNYYIDPFETNRHYIAYTDIGFARSIDNGKTWIWWDKNTWAPWRNTCYEIAFDPDIPGKMWGAFSNVHDIPNDNIISERHGHNGPGGVCMSRDFGASWRPEAQGLPLRPVTSIVLDPHSRKDNRTLYAGVFTEGVYKSTDDGKTWMLKKDGLGHPKNMRVSRVILHADGTLFAMICAKRPARGEPLASEGVGLYRSNDGAETWEKVNASHLFLYPKDFSVHEQNSNIVLVGTCDAGRGDQSGGLWRTQDGGRTWQRIGRQARQDLRRLLPSEARRVDLHDAHRRRSGRRSVALTGQRSNLATFRRCALLEHPARDVRSHQRRSDLRHYLWRQHLAWSRRPAQTSNGLAREARMARQRLCKSRQWDMLPAFGTEAKVAFHEFPDHDLLAPSITRACVPTADAPVSRRRRH